MSERNLTIGTRASPLALAQSRHVASAFANTHGWATDRLSLEEIITIGDQRLDTSLAEIGGKGLFTEELETGLLKGTLDFAVHSLKDLPTQQPDGLVLGAILPRAKTDDVLVPRAGLSLGSLADLPQGARVGTSALRRRAQILNARPDIDIIALRGNVGTRLAKLESEKLDAIILAAAGLHRLDLAPSGAVSLLDTIVPAAGQGALAVQCRADDCEMIDLLAALHCPATAVAIAAERSFLAALDGSCRTPIAAHAVIDGPNMHLVGRLLDDDGTWLSEASDTVQLNPHDGEAQSSAENLGRSLAATVRAKADRLSG